MLEAVFALLLVAFAFVVGFACAHPSTSARVRDRLQRVRRLWKAPRPEEPVITPVITVPIVAVADVADEPSLPAPTVAIAPSIRFDPIAPRGTQSAQLAEHGDTWRLAMNAVGERFVSSGVCAIVFVHGTFAGSDPLSAYRVVERALPGIGSYLARGLRSKTRGYIGRVLGDLGHFGTAYVRLFEEALRPRGARIPCTEFVWSSENHHVGRLEGALSLVRALATHAELIDRGSSRTTPERILVIGHSHAGQLFALVTQLLARSIAAEAILDIARARELDVASLEADIATLEACGVDFVTYGSPNRYAWAAVAGVRALHVIASAGKLEGSPGSGGVEAPSRRGGSGDWIRRLGVEGSDFPALAGEDRRINAALADSLGSGGFAPSRVATALRAGVEFPTSGDVALVDYGENGFLSTGLGHGSYTRLDAMLFHAKLVADRLYPTTPPVVASPPGRAWSLLRSR